MNIINGKEIYEHWYRTITNFHNALIRENVYLSFTIAPMVLKIPDDLLNEVWVQFDPDETDKQKCVIETIHGGMIYRKFNPFFDKKIIFYFEKGYFYDEQCLKNMRKIFIEVEIDNQIVESIMEEAKK